MSSVDVKAREEHSVSPNAARDTDSRPDPGKKQPQKPQRSPQRRLALGLVQGLAVTYLCILLAMIAMETRLVYPAAFSDENRVAVDQTASLVPGGGSAIRVNNRIADPEILTVRYPSTDGLTVSGRLLERGKDKQVVLFLHGNGSKAAWFDRWIRRLSEHLDANVMAAEYRGYEDEETPTENGLLADSLAARDFLCQRYQVAPEEIILFGRSLGGACAVAVAANGGAKALILDRTFDRLVDVAADKYPIFPVRWIMRNRFDSLAKITDYRGPLIMIHGDVDELVAMKRGRRLYDSAGCQPKHWIQVEGLSHNVPLSDPILVEVADTLQSLTKEAS
jgi:pimeloyl-ACP methyl ester carboxylesterase